MNFFRRISIILICLLFVNLLYAQDVNCISGNCQNGEGVAMLNPTTGFTKYDGEWRNGKMYGLGTAWPINKDFKLFAVWSGWKYYPVSMREDNYLLFTVISSGDQIFLNHNKNGVSTGVVCLDKNSNTIDCNTLMKYIK